MNWPVLKNLHETDQLIGLCSYYRRCIKNFVTHASPLHELTKLKHPFEWTERQHYAFNYLKTCLTTAPILALSQDVGKFVLDVDASDTALGAVLQQEQNGILRVIGYSSRILNKCEEKNCITRKELAAVIFGLKQYRQY